MLNHLVEEFGKGPWFTNPSDSWPSLAERLSNIYPTQFPFPISLVQFLGWLGDSGPGVFILLSGFGLTWAAIQRNEGPSIDPLRFYRRRLLRIFPLYITIHVLILAGSLMSKSSTVTFASPATLLSLLGLRFTDGLFFYINPSWWFVWLIIQLYLIYPLLWRMLKRISIRDFLLITIGFTVVSRFLGIIGIRYSDSLYYWMTGIFFGTRLAEFTVGMAVATWLAGQSSPAWIERRPLKAIVVFSLIYLIGLALSFTWPGTLFSNLLVTIGMSGIFYSVWEKLFRKTGVYKTLIVWIGVESYGVYLLHQTPLKWAGKFFDQQTTAHLLAAALVIVACFPISYCLSRAVNNFMASWPLLFRKKIFTVLTHFVTVITGVSLVIIEPRLSSDWLYRFWALYAGVAGIWLLAAEASAPDKESWIILLIRWGVLTSLFLKLFVFPPKSDIAIVTAALITLLALGFFRVLRSKTISWLAAGAGSLIIIFSVELGLAHFAPLEAGRWGEYPALEIHPTRTYGLKPNKTTRLKYNNYDYVLKTNSMGLASPEIDRERPDTNTLRIMVIGDAFAMPEGMEYEHSFPALLEERLRKELAPRSVQVINAGVTGYGPTEQLPQMRELVPIYKPDIVLYEFFINEFQEVSISRDERLESIGLMPRHKSMRRNIFARSQALIHLQKLILDLKERRSGIPASWRYFKSLLFLYQTGNNRYYSVQTKIELAQHLNAMHVTCEENGAKFIIYFVPGAVAVSKTSDITYFPWTEDLSDIEKYDLDRPWHALLSLTADRDVPVFDLTTFLRNSNIQPVYFPESWHWNRDGHKLVAGVIAEDLYGRGWMGK